MDNKLIGIRISKYMEEKNIKLEQLANIIDMNPKTLKNKLQGTSKFYVTDVIKIKEALNMDLEVFEELFFNFI